MLIEKLDGLSVEELDNDLCDEEDNIPAAFVEEALRLLVWVDDKRTVLLDRLEEAVEVLESVFVNEVESLVLNDRGDEILLTGFVEDDDSLAVDFVDFDEVLVAEDVLLEVDEGTGFLFGLIGRFAVQAVAIGRFNDQNVAGRWGLRIS